MATATRSPCATKTSSSQQRRDEQSVFADVVTLAGECLRTGLTLFRTLMLHLSSGWKWGIRLGYQGSEASRLQTPYKTGNDMLGSYRAGQSEHTLAFACHPLANSIDQNFDRGHDQGEQGQEEATKRSRKAGKTTPRVVFWARTEFGQISGRSDLRIASEETTGENDFTYKQWPEVVGVMVDKGSDRGFVQISGEEGSEIVRIHTGRGENDCVFASVSEGQSCMLYGYPTVIFIYPVSQ
ncbi:hypothetical protein Purlil1_13009 [Purpureocillium lilacinum]|uniref:Uncharacterized protein n=1 Tax=Purpureocillium lilacinum TaxID=33203 RepID=A0ABR0BFA4_PURLI|nr:hypothetical protein Purlil1_13009 [Purpureocillium lilacinum]